MTCSECGETGHNKRRHVGEVRNGVAPDLLDSIEPTPVRVESGADLVRAALKEAAMPYADRPAAPITLTGADPVSGDPLTNVADYVAPDPSGLDEFVDLGKATDAGVSAPVTPVDPGECENGNCTVCQSGIDRDRCPYCDATDRVQRHQVAGKTPMTVIGCPDPWHPVAPLIPPWRTSAGPDLPLRITEPGVYQLTADEYHDSEVTGEWLSNSDARQLISPGCPAKFRHNRDHGVKKRSNAFDLGHAAHTLVLGAGERIVVRPAQFDSWRTKDAQRWRAEQEAAGNVVLLPEEWETVTGMAAAIDNNRWASRLLRQPGRPEVALFWVCPDTGVKRRCMIDWLPSERSASGLLLPVDYKTCDNADPADDMERHIYKYGYHRQATTIADGIIALGLSDAVEFYLVFQEKQKPHVSTVVRLDSDSQRIGRIENRRALEVYARCLESGEWPEYSADPVVMGVPPYIAMRYEGETV